MLRVLCDGALSEPRLRVGDGGEAGHLCEAKRGIKRKSGGAKRRD